MTDQFQFPLTVLNQNLLTVFITITLLAILIQTGILAGLCLTFWRVSRRAEQALDSAHSVFAGLQSAVDGLQPVMERARTAAAQAEQRLNRINVTLRRRTVA